MITYELNEETGILETKIEGNIRIEDIINYIIDVRDNKMLPEKIKIFTEASKGKLVEKVRKKELEKFLVENKKTLNQKEFIYDAFVVSEPFETALGLLYQDLIEMRNYKFKIFTTKKAAIAWLNQF